MMRRLRSKHRLEEGSAYIVTLLALVVLTLLALTLTLVTQGEVQIGGSEKTINRLFYAADSGLALPAPKILQHNYDIDIFIQNRVHVGSGSNSSNVADRVTVGPPTAIDSYHADKGLALMEDTNLVQTANWATVRSERISWKGDGLPDATAEVLGSKILEVKLLIQPIDKPDVMGLPTLQQNLGAPRPPPS